MMPVGFSAGLSVISWMLTGASVDLDFVNNRYFGPSGGSVTSYLSISRASIGYANTSGGVLTQFSSGQLRRTDLGLLVEDVRTNVVLWNRDLTNVAWIKSNVTVALDQIGADGIINSASSIIATASNGTVLQSITLSSAAQFQSAWVKRLTGTGTINMTMDNGTTWTAISVTSSWTQVTIPGQTLANPTVGFQIVTNGDKIAVDFVQNETGAFASSPILTTTTSATRAADSVTCIGSLATIVGALPQSIFADITSAEPGLPQEYYQVISNNSAPNVSLLSAQLGSSNTISMYNGTTLLQSGAFLGGKTLSGGVKLASSQATNQRSIVGGGGTVATDTNTTVALANPSIGGNINAGEHFNGLYRRISVWNSKLADATLQAFTT